MLTELSELVDRINIGRIHSIAKKETESVGITIIMPAIQNGTRLLLIEVIIFQAISKISTIGKKPDAPRP